MVCLILFLFLRFTFEDFEVLLISYTGQTFGKNPQMCTLKLLGPSLDLCILPWLMLRALVMSGKESLKYGISLGQQGCFVNVRLVKSGANLPGQTVWPMQSCCYLFLNECMMIPNWSFQPSRIWRNKLGLYTIVLVQKRSQRKRFTQRQWNWKNSVPLWNAARTDWR